MTNINSLISNRIPNGNITILKESDCKKKCAPEVNKWRLCQSGLFGGFEKLMTSTFGAI